MIWVALSCRRLVQDFYWIHLWAIWVLYRSNGPFLFFHLAKVKGARALFRNLRGRRTKKSGRNKGSRPTSLPLYTATLLSIFLACARTGSISGHWEYIWNANRHELELGPHGTNGASLLPCFWLLTEKPWDWRTSHTGIGREQPDGKIYVILIFSEPKYQIKLQH